MGLSHFGGSKMPDPPNTTKARNPTGNSYTFAPWLRRARLREIIRAVEKKDRNLFVWNVADVNGAMNAITGLIPIDLPRCDCDVLPRMTVAKFDIQNIAFEDDRHAMERITMPSCGLARCKR
jgi:hypothetical protein